MDSSNSDKAEKVVRENKNVIGPNISKLRNERGWTLTELAARCQRLGFDISESSLSQIESRYRKVSDIELTLLAEALELPIDHPFFPKDRPEWKMRPWNRD